MSGGIVEDVVDAQIDESDIDGSVDDDAARAAVVAGQDSVGIGVGYAKGSGLVLFDIQVLGSVERQPVSRVGIAATTIENHPFPRIVGNRDPSVLGPT